MSEEKKLPKFYTCPHCKMQNIFTVWVFAHWDIRITHKCSCGEINVLKSGEVLHE